MKTISRLAVAVLAVGLLACPPAPSQPTVRDHRTDPQPDPDPQQDPQPDPDPHPDPDPDPDPQSELLADGEVCTDSGQCASGVCEGPGCDQGRCAPSQRACTRDLRPYCGCDGKVFRTSGTCPGRLFTHRGECGDDAAAGGTKKPNGADCLAAAECASGVCEGQGCGDDQPGMCMDRSRICTTDMRPYCGCDGKTFQSSGTCPGRRFQARGACQ